MSKQQLDSKISTCYHCGTPAGSYGLVYDEKAFCCSGCKTVYQILSSHDVCNYYELNEAPGKTAVNEVRSNQFDALDLPEVAAKYIVYQDESSTRASFYLPHIHCSSCLWLLEKLPSLLPGVENARVFFGQKKIQVTYRQQHISLKVIATFLASVGYEPYLPLEGSAKKENNKAQRTRIIRMGVAGFCLGNIMLFSFPEYLSLSPEAYGGQLMYWFRYLSLLLSLPVFFYSAMEFLQPAWQSLRKGFLTIDAPVSLAIIITFLRSVTDIVTNSGGGYLDSMSGIVFLMLVGRILQNRTQEALTFDRDYTSYFPVAAHLIGGEKEKPILLTHLKAGDVIKVYANEIIPADAMLSKGTALIDYSFVTGESIPVKKEIGDLIYAGGRQLEGSLELLLVKDVSKSYLTSLWNQSANEAEKTDSDSFIHPLAKYFTLLLLVLTAAVAAYWYFTDASKIWQVVTAMLIVACPCALLLSATFTYGHMVAALDRFGLYLRNHAMLERLLKVKHFVFDKTGTLTHTDGHMLQSGGDKLSDEEEEWLQAMAAQSNHPLSRGLALLLRKSTISRDYNIKEVAGKGIEAWINDHHVKLGSASFTGLNMAPEVNGSLVAWNIDGHRKGWFLQQASFRPGVIGMLRKMRQQYKISLLSGDHNARKSDLAELIGNHVDILLAQSPHNKKQFIEKQSLSGNKLCMIGDGLNDSGALKNAYVGIAVTDSINNFSPASDAILDAAKLASFNSILAFLSKGRLIIQLSFAISVLYNIVGLWFAASGLLSPLVCAILMPTSSISIILLTWFGVWLSAKKHLVKQGG